MRQLHHALFFASRRARGTFFVLGLGVLGGLPACFFPDYTFDETGSGGGSTSTTSSAGGASSTATTASSGGGGSSSVTTTTTSGTGGGAVEVNCLDNLDNDDDGDIDCADPDCVPGYKCAEAIPQGWGNLGYLELYDGSPAGVPSCPTEKPTTVYTGNGELSAVAASCTSCTCGAPSGQTCELTTDLDPNKAGTQPIQVKDAPCGSAASNIPTLTVPPAWGGVCYIAETLSGSACANPPCNLSTTSATPTVQGGSCVPGGGTNNAPAATWGAAGLACKGTLSGGGCAVGQSCQPRPQAPFESGICISKAGENDCPAGEFQAQHIFYGGFDDDRMCSGCTCGSATGGTCQLSISLFSDSTCVSAPIATFTAGTCADMVGNPDVAGRTATVLTPPSGGSCTPSGGTPSGGVAENTPTTFCCVP